MMHVMQPVVLPDSNAAGWPTTTLVQSSSVTAAADSHSAGVTVPVTSRPLAAVTAASVCSSQLINDVTNSQPAHSIGSAGAAFKTLNQADVLVERRVSQDISSTAASQQPLIVTAPANLPQKPPKKPCTPYLRFSKAVWPEVKQANPERSVCELGSMIGRMWREMTDADKQPYFDSFTQAKAEYDRAVKTYLDANDLKPSDLVRAKTVRKKPLETTTKKQSQPPEAVAVGDIQQQAWQIATGGDQVSRSSRHPAALLDGQSQTQAARGGDDLLVYHVRPDGSQECYVQRADGGMMMKPPTGTTTGTPGVGGEREMLLSTLAEQTGNVTQLQMQLINARARIVELEQQNQLLAQLLRDAQLLHTR